MKSIYAILIISTSILFLTSCDKDRVATYQQIFEVANNTNRIIVFNCSTSVGEQNLFLEGNDTNQITFLREEIKKDGGGVTIYGGDGDPEHSLIEIDIKKIVLYSITDTSKYIKGEDAKKDSLLQSRTTSLGYGSAWNAEMHTFIEIDTLLLDGILNKDYGILNQFPEYYE